MGKEMRIHWKNDLDVDTLESKGSWATLKELQLVLPYHLRRYKVIVENCKSCTSLVSPSDLTFATRFIATFLFLKIKATRPMTYQYLTVEMFEHAKTTGGYINQKLFKTTGTYGFDSIIPNMLSPNCWNWKFSYFRPGWAAMGLRGSETQLQGAKTHYQKKSSRDTAVKGQSCLKKLCGAEGEHVEKSLQMILGENTDHQVIWLEPLTKKHQFMLMKFREPTVKPIRKAAIQYESNWQLYWICATSTSTSLWLYSSQ